MPRVRKNKPVETPANTDNRIPEFAIAYGSNPCSAWIDDLYVRTELECRHIRPARHSSQDFSYFTREIIDRLIEAERSGAITRIDFMPNYYGEVEVKISWREGY